MNLLLDHGADADTIRGAFLDAALSGNSQRMERFWPLLKHRADEVSEDLVLAIGWQPSLTEETDRKKQEIADFFLQHGADPNFQTEGWGALHKAALNGMPRVAKSLLAAGANVNRPCECPGQLDGGWTPLALALNNFSDEPNGHEQTFYLLIDNGADVNADSNSGLTVLIWAIKEGEEEMVMRLIDKGADVNTPFRKASSAISTVGNTPLMFAINRSNMNSVLMRLIEKGADVNAANENGWTALMLAAWYDHGGPEYIRILLDHGAQINAKNNEGKTSLMLAVQSGRSDIVATLLEYGADLRTRDIAGKTTRNLAEEFLEGIEKSKMLSLLSEAEAKGLVRKAKTRRHYVY